MHEILSAQEQQSGTATSVPHAGQSDVINKVYALSVWSEEFGQLRTGTGMEVSLTVFSWQRWDTTIAAAPPPLDSLRR